MRWGVGWRNRPPRLSAQRGIRLLFWPHAVLFGVTWGIGERQRHNVGFVSENAEFPEFAWRELHVYVHLIPCLPVHVLWGLPQTRYPHPAT